MRISGKAASDGPRLAPGAEAEATLTVSDPDADALTIRWEILAEVERAGYAGMGEKHSQAIPGLIGDPAGSRIRFEAPSQPGAYRLFVIVTDGRGNAATANVPFLVEPRAR
jgi:hypothetical protein